MVEQVQCCVLVSSIVHALEDSNGFARNGVVILMLLITMSCLVLDSLSCWWSGSPPSIENFKFYGLLENPRGSFKQVLLCQVGVLVPRLSDCCPGLLRSAGFEVVSLRPRQTGAKWIYISLCWLVNLNCCHILVHLCWIQDFGAQKSL